MARINKLMKLGKDRHAVHGSVDCGYSSFTSDGDTYLQLDTYGSSERQIPGKTSQSIQLDRSSAAELKRLIERVFPGI